MRTRRILPVAFWVPALALIVDSILRGGASVWLVLVFPVVSGQSLEFLVGALLLFAGFLSLPWALFEEEEAPREAGPMSASSRTEPPSATGSTGGVILVGPVPILLGSWRTASRRARWWLAVAGGAIALVLVAMILLGW